MPSILILAVAALALVGCPQPTDPVKDMNANLGTLAVNAGRLSPGFVTTTTVYDVGVRYDQATIIVTATAESSKASIAINGQAGSELEVALDTDRTMVSVVVTAEAGNTSGYTLFVDKADSELVPVSFLVAESVDGATVSGSTLTAYDSLGAIVDTTTVTGGSAVVNLEPDALYTFEVQQAGYAASSLQNYYVSPLGGNDVTMIQQKLGMITRPATAPLFDDISLSRLDDFTDAATLVAGQQLNTAGTTYILVAILSDSATEATAWSGFGVKADFDYAPSSLNGMDAIMLMDPYFDTDAGKYVNLYLVDLSGGEYPAGEHDLVLVAYDVANNRAETRIPVIMEANGSSGADVSEAVFSDLLADLRAYPVSRGFFSKDPGNSIQALDPYEGHDVSYRAQISFKLTDGATTPANVAIRGFDLYRREAGQTSFKKVGATMYGALSTGSSGTHSMFDSDSGLEAGVTYEYMIVAYTDASHTVKSSVATSKVMAPFSASLVGPANRSTASFGEDGSGYPYGPEYSFSISDTSLWNATESDFFYFALTVNEKAGPYAYYGKFRFNFSTSNFEALNAYTGSWLNLGSSGSIFDYTGGTITFLYGGYVAFINQTNLVNGAPIQYTDGAVYEWDIIGDLSGGHPAWFEKAYTGGIAKSYADGYSEGANTSNGRFEVVAAVAP